MDPLIEGYRKFRAETWPAERARYEALAHWGQSPETMVIACSDSRVDPQTVFGAVPGELFVVRNVAALVPPYEPDARYHGTSAALEFGVKVLKVARLVVLGHGQCGGVRAMAYGPPPQARDFIASWVEIGKPALAAAGEAEEGRLGLIEAEVVRLSLKNLDELSPGSPRRPRPGGSCCRVICSTSTQACSPASAATGSRRSSDLRPTSNNGPKGFGGLRPGRAPVANRSIAETASGPQGGFGPLGDDGEPLHLPGLKRAQEGVVVLERHAPVEVAVRPKHVRMRQQSRPAEDVAVAEGR